MNKRLKHLYDLYQQEPTNLTLSEFVELVNAGMVEWHPCGDCAYYGDCKLNSTECQYSFNMKGETYE